MSFLQATFKNIERFPTEASITPVLHAQDDQLLAALFALAAWGVHSSSTLCLLGFGFGQSRRQGTALPWSPRVQLSATGGRAWRKAPRGCVDGSGSQRRAPDRRRLIGRSRRQARPCISQNISAKLSASLPLCM